MKFVGTPVSAGVVVGKTYLYERFVPEISALAVGNPVEDATHYAIARDTAQKELEGLRRYFAEANDPEKQLSLPLIWKFWQTRPWTRKFGMVSRKGKTVAPGLSIRYMSSTQEYLSN